MVDLLYKALRISTILLPVVLLFRLAFSGMMPRYRWLFVMFLTGVVRDVVLAFFELDTAEYNQIWAMSLPFVLIASIVAAGAAIRRLLTSHAALSKSAVYLCSLGFGLTCFITIACALLEQSGNLEFMQIVRVAFQVDQCVTMLLAGSLVVTAGFILLSPAQAPLPDADLRNFYLLMMYFCMDCVMQILLNLCPLSATAFIEMFGYASSAALYLAWIYSVAPRKPARVSLREMRLVG